MRETADAVGAGRRRATDVVEDSLSRIAAGDAKIRAFLEVTGELALAEARAVDARVAAGGRRPRAGVPRAGQVNKRLARGGGTWAARAQRASSTVSPM